MTVTQTLNNKSLIVKKIINHIDCEQFLFCSRIRGKNARNSKRESRARAAKPRVARARLPAPALLAVLQLARDSSQEYRAC